MPRISLIQLFCTLSFIIICSSFRPNTKIPNKFLLSIKCKAIVADEIDGWDASKYSWFIKNYWQLKPLLIRNAVTLDDALRYTKADVVYLSQDDDVECRLVRKRKNKWVKDYGPFEADKITSLPPSAWTVLVQEVDRHLPWVADLWTDYFNFIPLWRRDDVMVSYSAVGGGIGGHVDNYDVFLIQGNGVKEWAIENKFVTHDEELMRELPNSETRLLADFTAGQTWILKPGDMLYLPPRVPHRGYVTIHHNTPLSHIAQLYIDDSRCMFDKRLRNIINGLPLTLL